MGHLGDIADSKETLRHASGQGMPDLDQHYSRFARGALPEESLWRLTVATQALPRWHIGCEAWLASVSKTRTFDPKLRDWVLGLVRAYARLLSERNDRIVVDGRPLPFRWEQQAALDGLEIAVGNPRSVPSPARRAMQLRCPKTSYRALRRFICRALRAQARQFRAALLLALHAESAIDGGQVGSRRRAAEIRLAFEIQGQFQCESTTQAA